MKAAWGCTTRSFRTNCLIRPDVFKERLSQSSLYAAMQQVTDAEAREVARLAAKKGNELSTGVRTKTTELTESQTLQQCKMYVAAVRIADEFGCDTIGIQYQQGLRILARPAIWSRGRLNNVDRPAGEVSAHRPVLFDGEPLPHFNEVDECAGLDGLVTYRLWRELGLPPRTRCMICAGVSIIKAMA